MPYTQDNGKFAWEDNLDNCTGIENLASSDKNSTSSSNTDLRTWAEGISIIYSIIWKKNQTSSVLLYTQRVYAVRIPNIPSFLNMFSNWWNPD